MVFLFRLSICVYAQSVLFRVYMFYGIVMFYSIAEVPGCGTETIFRTVYVVVVVNGLAMCLVL